MARDKLMLHDEPRVTFDLPDDHEYIAGLERIVEEFIRCAKYDALPAGLTFTGWSMVELARALNRAKQFTREWW